MIFGNTVKKTGDNHIILSSYSLSNQITSRHFLPIPQQRFWEVLLPGELTAVQYSPAWRPGRLGVRELAVVASRPILMQSWRFAAAAGFSMRSLPTITTFFFSFLYNATYLRMLVLRRLGRPENLLEVPVCSNGPLRSYAGFHGGKSGNQVITGFSLTFLLGLME